MQAPQHSSELLTNFILAYNQEQEQLEQDHQIHALYRSNAEDDIAILKSRLEAEKRLTTSLNETIAAKDAELSHIEKEVELAFKQAKNTTNLNARIASLETQLKLAQEKVRELNQLNPKKLKEQVKRLKEASEKSQARAKKLEQDNKEYRLEKSDIETALNKAADTIIKLKHDIERNTGTGVYHSSGHHLIVWPQPIKIQREDGSHFTGRTLLYLHESGRGGLIAQDSDSKAHLCTPPKGGLRPSKGVMEFAETWLNQVNEIQGGVITDADMIPVNENIS
ncbi:CAP-Gly domain-containing linker protein 1 [Pseudoalteromonas phage vB_Pun_Y3]